MLIYNHSVVDRLLSCLLKDSTLCLNSKYPFDPKASDFCTRMHKYVWGSIVNLAKRGYKVISIMDLEEYMKSYATVWSIYNDNGGRAYINTIMKLGDSKNFDGYYEQVRLYSAIRDYQSLGYDISKFWDINKKDEDNIAGLDDVKVEDVINHFEGLQVGQKKKYNRGTNVEEVKLGTWFKEIKEEFMQTPRFGASWFSDFLNTATRGFIKGQFTVFSMPSEAGKSTIAISTLCKVCCDELWDDESKSFVKNKSFMSGGAMYLQYEMAIRSECTPKFVATISGVPCNHILNGKYEDGESERVDHAIEIMERNNIHIVLMPSFTSEMIETYVRDYVLNYGVEYVVFDYISEQSSISAELSKKNGVATRMDNVLSAISSVLKDLATTLDIAMLSFTQTNANLNSVEYLNASCISGSMAIQNKCDVAGVICAPRPKEEAIWNELKSHPKFKVGDMKCNRIIHLYKVRFGSEEQGIKIWGHLNLSNGKFTDLVVTNRDNIPYNMQPSTLEVEK